MTGASHIVGDWGTSRLRLILCDHSGAALARLDGPGAAAMTAPYPEVFAALIEPWESQFGPLRATLCGMVGSNIGWVQTPYLSCPAAPEKIIGGCKSLNAGRVRIVPGLQCENRLLAPDFMRGEETQILGAQILDPGLCRGRHLLCLPGTHTKWVILDQGIIREFLSAPTGEVFAVLRNHSVLVREDSRDTEVMGGAEFEEGLKQFNAFPDASLLHRLFECRSRVLAGELAAKSAGAFLSGLLIAADVAGALRLLSNTESEHHVVLIGAPRLAQLYACALAAKSHDTRPLDGGAASLAGLTRIAVGVG